MVTPFQKKVYQAGQKIPKGRISTYKLLAEAIGQPGAFRAVGQALNKNPDAPKVPCHRVVRSDGSVGGFAWGRRKKKNLLAKEGLKFRGNKITDFKKHCPRLN